MSRNRQLKISIEPGLAGKFKEYCETGGVSMAERLTQLMEAEIGLKAAGAKTGASLGTRGERRGATRRAIALLEAVMDAEEAYMERIPDNLRGGAGHEAAEQAIDALDQAIGLLGDAFP